VSRPTRDTSAGRAYLDLQKQARRDRRPTDELMQIYALEGFLDRLTRSLHADRFVLKGGLLLAAYGERRATRDIDLQADMLGNEVESIRRVICEIADLGVDDGLVFGTAEATAEVIRDEQPYAGVRVSMSAELVTARLHFHVDVSVGDPITPVSRAVHVPRILGGEIIVRAHPLAMVYAEKVVTALARGSASTRWRDFADIYLLSRSQLADAGELAESIRRVASHRQVELRQLASVLRGYGDIGQRKWAAWCRRQQLDNRLPTTFTEVLDAVLAFAEPVISGDADGLAWDPEGGAWR
jgi:hypothetical protein